MIVVSGGDLILSGRLVSEGSLIIEGGRITAIESRRVDPAGATIVDASDCYVAPGFIDVHVHGLHGHDTLDGEGAVAHIAALLPRYGVTAFCPTTVACGPDDLRSMLQQVRQARVAPVAGSARVLPAHLESNFINSEYKGAQPADCLRHAGERSRDGVYSAADILDVISVSRPDVGIVTMAPELPGAVSSVPRAAASGPLFGRIGDHLRRPDVVQFAGMMVMMPFMFVSSAFAPLDTMPGWMRAAANGNPVNHATDALRGAILGTTRPGDVMAALVAAAAMWALVAAVPSKRS